MRKRNSRRHSYRGTPTYRSWIAMRTRCNNPRFPRYPDYGGAGIKVCRRWNDFLLFLADMGERPDGTTIDRIDNRRGYSPANCRWATPLEQSHNRPYVKASEQLARKARRLVHQGMMQKDVALLLNKSRAQICRYMKKDK